MSDLLTNQITNKQLLQFIDDPSNCLLLVGKNGSGKLSLANYLVNTILGTSKTIKNGIDYIVISPNDGLISIENIRDINTFLRLKTVGESTFRRAVIIEHAEAMPTGAQNALLKLIEEPPEDTLIIMTVDSKNSLLPTVLSRLKQIDIKKVAQAELKDYLLTKGYDDESVKLGMLVSDNLVGRSIQVLSGESEMNLDVLNKAKKILLSDTYTKLLEVNELVKDKSSVKLLIDGLIEIAKASLANAASKNNIGSLKNWNKILKEAIDAKASIAMNANPKLVLDKLFLNI